MTSSVTYNNLQVEAEMASLNRKVQTIEEDLERSEERLGTATTKLAEASQAADESSRMCKVLENRSQQDEERMDQLTNQLKEARMLGEQEKMAKIYETQLQTS